jgi:hypothetical protein
MGVTGPDHMDISSDWPRYQGLKTLILGDVNTGKTFLTERILVEAMATADPADICVIDLAPHIPEELLVRSGHRKIGGQLSVPDNSDVLYLIDRIDPPRLSTDSEIVAVEVARQNLVKIDALFETAESSGRPIWIVNDLSMYVQAGAGDSLPRRFEKAESVVANGYYGQSLGAGKLSAYERREMDWLAAWFPRVIRLANATHKIQGEF